MSIVWIIFSLLNKFDDVVVMVGLVFFASVDLMLVIAYSIQQSVG